MKPLSIRFAFAMLAWALFCSAFTPSQPAAVNSKQTWYYFYTYPDDMYNNYCSVADEEASLNSVLGVTVDTNMGGGTLVARGYFNNNDPHTMLPSVLLYAHY
jgi:hypothetical protein